MRTWILLLLVGTALAGCADSTPPADDDDPFDDFDGDLKATKETGIIRGVVFDPMVNPIGGVNVSIAETSQQTLTDEEGRFGFAGLAEGYYTLTATKAGFEAASHQTFVKAGESQPSMVKMQISVEPASMPTTEPLYLQGHIGCSITVVTVSHATCDTEPIKELTNNEFILYHTFDRTADWVQSEMTWRSTQTLGDSMSLSWTDFSTGFQRTINSTAGPSPLMISFDREVFEELNLTGKELWLRVFSTAREGTDVVPEEVAHGAWGSTGYSVYNGTGQKGVVDGAMEHDVFGIGTQSPLQEGCFQHVVLFRSCIGARGVGATVQQDYEVFTTKFFNFQPTPGWMFVVDGEHPLPEPA